MVHIPLELVLTLGPVFLTVAVLTLIDSMGFRVSGSARRLETYFNRNASWPLPTLDRARDAARLAARMYLARTGRS